MSRTSTPASIILRRLPGLLLLAWATQAPAMQFWPTEAEWLTWPEYCRARYTITAVGKETEFSTRVSASVVSAWEDRMGPVWGNLHHYCAGIAYEERARIEHDREKRTFWLREGIMEQSYTIARTPETHPLYAEIATRLGLLHRDLGENEDALRSFDLAIEKCPTCASGYQGKATYYRDARQYELALDTLEKGNEATGGESAELQYLLGLVLVDMKNYESAREHARMAYELGYPLPALRDKLARAGYPLQ